MTHPDALPEAVEASKLRAQGIKADILHHAVDLEQCSLFVDSAPLKRSMTDAAQFLSSLIPPADKVAEPFQDRVAPWMQACFGPEVSGDKLERGDRFLEEALELLQSGNYPRERIAALTDYVFDRPQGEINQEVGGVMVTLAAYCLAFGLDMHAAGETELARIWTKVEQIRAKQASKPVGSALPVAAAEGAETPMWRCFHCDEVFTDEHSARLHFGNDETAAPACQIKGSEHGLVEALREAENDAAEAWHMIHAETTDAAKAYYSQNSRHQRQMRAIEQVGYDRGIADAKAYPETLGLVAADKGAETQPIPRIEIAKLEWTAYPNEFYPDVYGNCWDAKTPFGKYQIEERSASDSGSYYVNFGVERRFVADKDGLPEAQEAAQADYEAGVRSIIICAAAQPNETDLEDARLESYRCDIAIVGIVDGMDQPDLSGSYLKLSINSDSGYRCAITMSIGAAEVFAAELVGFLDGPADKGAIGEEASEAVACGTETEGVLRRDGFHLSIEWWRRGQHCIRRIYEPQMMSVSPALADLLVMALEEYAATLRVLSTREATPLEASARPIKTSFTVNLTDTEIAVLEALAKKQELSPQKVLIQGLRHYQLFVEGEPDLGPMLAPDVEATPLEVGEPSEAEIEAAAAQIMRHAAIGELVWDVCTDERQDIFRDAARAALLAARRIQPDRDGVLPFVELRIIFENDGLTPNLRFIEVETIDGKSVRAGTWMKKGNYDVLALTVHKSDVQLPAKYAIEITDRATPEILDVEIEP